MKVYEALAELFRCEQATHCFALLGDANMNWAAALEARGTQFIYVRDEHNAVAAAMSWARTSGSTGIASVTCGPGLTQILTALPAAVRARIPLVIFSGEAPLRKPWYNQGIEQKPFVEACGAHYISLVEGSGSEHALYANRLRDAFNLARTESCPVVVGMPLDVQEDEWSGGEVSAAIEPYLVPATKLVPTESELAKAVELVVAAKRVVVLAGLGAIKAQASEKCRELAEATGALLATTLPARGLFWQDPYYLGVAGGFASDTARTYLQQADLVIAVGSRLASHTSDGGKLWSADRVLHIDYEPRERSQGIAASHHHLRSDALTGVDQLLQATKAHALYEKPESDSSEQGSWRTRAIADEIATTPADSYHYAIEPGLLDPRKVISTIDELLPTDWHTVNSSGHCSWFAAQMYRRPADRFFTLREFGAIGNGLAFALGVAVADTARPVVLFDGDGSFLMHIHELETIARHRLKVLVCVLNDGAYGSEIHKLRAHGLADNGGLFGRPDFAAIAKGFGLQGHQITGSGDTTLEQLPELMQEFGQGDAAVVWDFHVSDQVVSPLIRRSHNIN